MRALLIAALFASFAIAAMAQSGGPSPIPLPPAKPQAPATTGLGAAAGAPVGHRQPNKQSLPRNVRDKEAAPAAPDPLGPLPKICRDC
jgi:hypothetical protein